MKPHLALVQETAPPSIAFEAGRIVQARAYAAHAWSSAVFLSDGELQELSLPDDHRG